MTKVLLVEDDNNLREIYEARLAAEGYDISTAKDGEDALAVAKQVKPDLIISDVMMPRISGFEMLDILRNTDGLKHTKIIMLTALGQAEDKTRADSLGADRYLVKSQVTLEDIVKAADELLNPDATQPATPSAADPAPNPVPTAPANTFSPIAPPDVAAAAHQPETASSTPTMPTVSASEPNDNPEAAVTPIPDVPVQPAPEPPQPTVAQAPTPASATQPAPSVTPPPAPEPTVTETQDEEPLIQMPPQPVGTDAAVVTTGQAQSTSQENAAVAQQIENFVNTSQPTPPPAAQPEPAPATPTPEPPTGTPGNNDDVIKAAIDDLAATNTPSEEQPAPATPVPEPPVTPPSEPSVAQIPGKKVITPLSDPNTQSNDLQTLLAQEQMKEDKEKGVTGTPVVGDVAPAPSPEEPAQAAPPTSTQNGPSTAPPGGVFTPNENGSANENAL